MGDFQPLLAQVGRWLVYVGDGVATAIADDLTGRPRVLGPTPFFAPAAAPGRVWLFRFQHGAQGPIRAWTVSLSGGPPSRPVTLPAGAFLTTVRGTDAGLLVQVPRGLALWNPGSVPAILPSSPGFADGFDATSRLVAYGTGCTSQATAPDAPQDPGAGYDTCRALQVLDVVTGKLISFPAPPGTAGWVPNGFNLVSAISHDNRMIAAYAATRPRAGRPGAPVRAADRRPFQAGPAGPVVGRVPVRQDRVVGRRHMAAVPGPWRAPVGLSGDPRPDACLQHAMLPVHGDGRRAKSQRLTS